MKTLSNDNLLHQIEEVETVYSKKDANQYLKQGWKLLSVGSGQEQTGSNDYQPFFGYCLGKVKVKRE